MKFSLYGNRARIFYIAFSILLYILTFNLIYSFAGNAVGITIVIITAFAGFYYGSRFGILTSILLLLANIILYHFTKTIDNIHITGFTILNLSAILAPFLTGKIHDLLILTEAKKIELESEIERRKDVESLLQQEREQLEDRIEERTKKLIDSNETLQIEISKREAIEKRLKNGIEFEALISKICQRIVNSNDEDSFQLLEITLKEVTDFVKCSRSYVYFFSEDKEYSNYYAGYVQNEFLDRKQLTALDSINNKDCYLIFQILNSKENFLYLKKYDKDFIDNYPVIKGRKVTFLYLFPIIYKNNSIGFIGFDSDNEDAAPLQEELHLLETISKLIEHIIIRQKTLDELTFSENKYKRISHLVSDFAFSIKLKKSGESQIEWITDSFYKIIGYKPDDLKAGWKNIIYYEDIEKIQEIINLSFEGISFTKEIRLTDVNNNIIYCKFFIEPELIGDHIVIIYGGAQNITIQRTMENILKENARKFKILFNNNPFPMVLIDPDSFSVVDNNDAALREFECEGEGILNIKFTELVTGDYKTEIEEKIRHKEEIDKKPSVYPFTTKKQNLVLLEIYFDLAPLDNKQFILAVFRNVTDKIRLENDNKLLAHSLKSVQECITITDRKNNIIFVNDAFCKTYGFELNEVLGKNIEILRLDENKNLLKIINDTDKYRPYKGELLNKKKDGTVFPILLTTSDVRDDEGKISALVGVALDITDLKEAEYKLRNALDIANSEKSKNEAIIKGLGEAISIQNKNYEIIYQNEIEKEYFHDKGKYCYSNNSANSPCPDCPLQNSDWNGSIINKEKIIVNGSQKYFDVTISPLKDEKGEITGVIELSKDITEKKEIELNLKDKISQVELISALLYGFSGLFDIKQLILYIYENFPLHIDKVDNISLLLYDENRNVLFGSKNLIKEDLHYQKKSTFTPDNSKIEGKCFLQNKIIYLPECENSGLFTKKYLKKKGIKSSVAVPLNVKNKLIGVLRLDNCKIKNSFDVKDIDFFGLLAEQLAMIIENDRLIEQLKESEAKIKLNEDYLNHLLNSLHAGIFVINPETYIIEDVNDYALNLIGLKKEEVVNKLRREFISPGDVENYFDINENPDKISQERILIDKSGKQIPILKSVIEIQNNEKPILIETCIDITELKKVESELRENKEKLQKIFQNLTDVVLFVDEDLKIISINTAIEQISGYKAEELEGYKLDNTSVAAINIFTKFKGFIKEIINAKDLNPHVFDLPHKEGYFKKVEISGSKCIIDDRRYAICVLRDITESLAAENALHNYNLELVSLNKKLEQSRKELTELNTNKDKFFSIIAHDLRSPFNALLGFSAFLQSDYDQLSAEEVKTFSSHINSSAKQLFNLLENLLQWSRIQTGRIEYKPQNIKFIEIAKTVVSLLEPNANKKMITLTNEIEPELIVYSDLNSINSVLQNLVSNAIKFTHIQGSITLSSTIENNFAVIKVKDNGVGMSEKNVMNLFKIEVQHSTDGTEKEKGTGLGLILCKELVEKNKGKISVESKVGEGTTFKFTLPLGN